MVEKGPVVHVLTTERDLIPGGSEEKKTGLIAVGSPTFAQPPAAAPAAALRETAITCDSLSRMQFSPLPGSLSEAKDISSVWKRWNPGEHAELLTGDHATRANFLQAASQSRILHVATHAFILDKSCGNGNPLLHSGLVFAGANENRDASILTAQQIASLDLSGVNWAVLSACNTGNGELKDGEGVLGLERSFRVAGARSVVMTLWPVDDEVTREFMRKLYAERFERRATTADATWFAARKMLAGRKLAGKSTHPWYWAGFVGAGDWR
jgi:CHAT domain-containing protein